MLERILKAADYRPSLPLAELADSIATAAGRHGLSNVRVFGSTVRGEDHFDSDIDLLVTPSSSTDLFDLALFANEVRELTGFHADVIVDAELSLASDSSTLEAVPL
ncbi:XRE family transcriptional regulator [Gulosibacter molinativorax]|nr:XRE family transcriptional regulator [Gulosibacter molinativorax]